MYDRASRQRAIRLVESGLGLAEVSRATSISRAALREWLRDPVAAVSERRFSACFACAGRSCPSPVAYTYLLGQYLGDGHLVTSSRVPVLRIACADTYPEIAGEVDTALATISGNRVGAIQRVGCSEHYSYWMHWPCLLPQHGPGRKHERAIRLAEWQRAIVDEHPWSLIRGLIHSDGCRTINRVVVHGVEYRYPRYFFSNESRDILTIMGDALDRVCVAWRFNRPNSISIARRAAVAAMDAHLGPKS